MPRGQPWKGPKGRVRVMPPELRAWNALYIMTLLVAIVFTLAGCSTAQQPPEVGPEQIAAEIIPQEGEATSYGIPLSLENTQQFINYYQAVSLTPEQEQVKRDALTALRAPCCDDNTMYNC